MKSKAVVTLFVTAIQTVLVTIKKTSDLKPVENI